MRIMTPIDTWMANGGTLRPGLLIEMMTKSGPKARSLWLTVSLEYVSVYERSKLLNWLCRVGSSDGMFPMSLAINSIASQIPALPTGTCTVLCDLWTATAPHDPLPKIQVSRLDEIRPGLLLCQQTQHDKTNLSYWLVASIEGRMYLCRMYGNKNHIPALIATTPILATGQWSVVGDLWAESISLCRNPM